VDSTVSLEEIAIAFLDKPQLVIVVVVKPNNLITPENHK
jgi:hypothetical protein